MDKRLLTGNFIINEANHLAIGQIDMVDLAKEYGTPTIVYDVGGIRDNIRAFKNTFEKLNIKYDISYASKAFSAKAIYRVVKEEGISIDVVSGGELYTALEAGFPAEHIHFHGNNKSPEELRFALASNVGTIMVDNNYELALLNSLVEEGQKQNIILRVAPGIEASTHEFIATGQRDSKFGFDLENGHLDHAVQSAMASERLNLRGLHVHIGSQIFETDGFGLIVDKLVSVLANYKETLGFEAEVLNVGGGYGIRYTSEDEPLPLGDYIEVIVNRLKEKVAEYDIQLPEVWIEPGRSIVGDTAITLYTTGSQKLIPGIRDYLAVDGGMTDNIRPALYGAQYSAVLADEVEGDYNHTYALAGKCCESGDMLIKELNLPKIEEPRTLAVFSTGAYGYSMASNYNRLPRPLVLFVEDGQVEVAIRRETYQDLVKLDQ